MKKIAIILISLVTLTACEGDRGPQGPSGLNGYLGTTAEFFVDFGNSNDFTYYFADDGIEVYESDAVLVYRSEEFIQDPTGDIDVWKLMPQSIFFPDGTQLQYSYDHTFEDVRIFLDGNLNLNTLEAKYTQNQLFRVVVVPSEYANNPNIDIQTYQGLVNSLNKQGVSLETIQ